MNEINRKKPGLADHLWRNSLLKNYREKIQEATETTLVNRIFAGKIVSKRIFQISREKNKKIEIGNR